MGYTGKTTLHFFTVYKRHNIYKSIKNKINTIRKAAQSRTDCTSLIPTYWGIEKI
ncbi:hypothetical protein CCP3SC1AL1_590002 [Gammaproteobacteria bacterium]